MFSHSLFFAIHVLRSDVCFQQDCIWVLSIHCNSYQSCFICCTSFNRRYSTNKSVSLNCLHGNTSNCVQLWDFNVQSSSAPKNMADILFHTVVLTVVIVFCVRSVELCCGSGLALRNTCQVCFLVLHTSSATFNFILILFFYVFS